MTPERESQRKPHEVFGITDNEVTRWRVADERLKEILANPNTKIHEIKSSVNNYGEFIFITTSRGKGARQICMTFWGLGHHQYRDRYITQEWFWHQTPSRFVNNQLTISQEDTIAQLHDRFDSLVTNADQKPQSELGFMFEEIADLTDDDAAIAEFQDLGLL